MPVVPYVPGIPGFRAAITATQKIIFKGGIPNELLPSGRLVDGVNARDPTNNPVTTLSPGILLGKITASGLYGCSIIDTLVNAFTAGGTTMTISTAGATELVRRIGTSGTFQLTGPPSANGSPCRSVTVTYSAVVLATGVITLTNPGFNFVAGSFIQPTDGSQNILTFVPDGYGITVVDTDQITSITQQLPEVPIGGMIISSALVNWPTDLSLQQYIMANLNGAGGGQYMFDHIF